MTEVIFSVRQTSDGYDVKNVSSGWCDEPFIEFDKVPRFEFIVNSHGGVDMFGLFLGKEVEIRRMGRNIFPGIIDDVAPTDGGGKGLQIKVSGVHRGYHVVKGLPLTNYDFDEDGSARTTRDAVTINPWQPFLFRQPDGDLDVNGLTPIIDGFPLSYGVRSVLGSFLLFQHDFQDNSLLLPSSLSPHTLLTADPDDSSNNNRNLTPVGSPTVAFSDFVKYGTGYDFVETYPPQYLFSSDPIFDYDSFTLFIAFKADILQGRAKRTLMAYGNGNVGSPLSNYELYLSPIDSTNGAIVLAIAGGTFSIPVTTDDSADGSSESLTETTHAVLFTYDDVSKTMRAYLDGADAGSSVFTIGKTNIGTGQFRVASNPNDSSSSYDGKVYEVRVGAALSTPQQALDLTNRTSQAYRETPVGWEDAIWYFGTANAATPSPFVYRDGQSGDKRPVLQRPRDGAGFKSGNSVETVPILNGDWNVGRMEPIQFVFVDLYGIPSGETPTVDVCGDALNTDGSSNLVRTYSAAPLSGTSFNVNGSTLTKWTFIATLQDTSVRNAVGLRITIPGDEASSATTKIHFLSVRGATDADTPQFPITYGDVDEYYNPSFYSSPTTANLLLGRLETDLYGLRPIDALERIRKITVSRDSVNPSPHWDMWIDENLALNFKERRGSDKTLEYSFPEENVEEIQHRFLGDQIAYQTIAYGPGSENAQMRIISREEYGDGGLYDADRDPHGPTRIYGDLPQVLDFVDQNEKSAVALLNKAQAFHKLHRNPIESLQVKIIASPIQHFATGDTIRLFNPRSRTNENMRVVGLRREWGGNVREQLRVELGEPIDTLVDSIHRGGEDIDLRATRNTPQNAVTGISGEGTSFDSTHYGIKPFIIENGDKVDRVKLKVLTLPWQATARATKSSPIIETMSVGFSEQNQIFSAGETKVYSFTMGSEVTSGASVYVTSGSLAGSHRVEIIANGYSIYDAVKDSFPAHSYGLTMKDLAGKTITVNVTNTTASNGVGINSRINVFAIAPHAHKQEYGINQFNGDRVTDGGVSQAVYGSGIKFAVDPDTNAGGLPIDFESQRAQILFGDETSSTNMEFDVTGFLDTETNGIIKNGVHRVYLVSTPTSSNSKGLSVVNVSPIIKYKEANK